MKTYKCPECSRLKRAEDDTYMVFCPSCLILMFDVNSAKLNDTYEKYHGKYSK
jgi:hypothetical protein